MHGFRIVVSLIALAWLLGLWRQRGRHGNDDSEQDHGDPPARGWAFGSKEIF